MNALACYWFGHNDGHSATYSNTNESPDPLAPVCAAEFEADLLGGFEIHHQLEFSQLLKYRWDAVFYREFGNPLTVSI